MGQRASGQWPVGDDRPIAAIACLEGLRPCLARLVLLLPHTRLVVPPAREEKPENPEKPEQLISSARLSSAQLPSSNISPGPDCFSFSPPSIHSEHPLLGYCKDTIDSTSQWPENLPISRLCSFMRGTYYYLRGILSPARAFLLLPHLA